MIRILQRVVVQILVRPRALFSVVIILLPPMPLMAAQYSLCINKRVQRLRQNECQWGLSDMCLDVHICLGNAAHPQKSGLGWLRR